MQDKIKYLKFLFHAFGIVSLFICTIGMLMIFMNMSLHGYHITRESSQLVLIIDFLVVIYGVIYTAYLLLKSLSKLM